ncbi:MAG: hypothetical protein GKS04_03270 [Candidatus Mycalebacterium zealandia]|nr:MAG: hypothetical protein GKS04_03270 [Candidatus Mycalebacterium zealandia]
MENLQVETANAVEPEMFCLGLKALGECLYNPLDPPIYFSLGALISSGALFFVLIQIVGPIHRFRFAVNISASQKILGVFLIVVAILGVFLATIVPLLSGAGAYPVLGYPVFWETLSAFLFVFLICYTVRIVFKPVKFTSGNAVKYLNATISFLAKADGKALEKLAEEIYPSIKNVVNEATNYDYFKALQAKEDGKTYEVSKATKAAITVLDVWSDKMFCKSIVCQFPQSAVEILGCLSKKLHHRAGYSLCSEIIQQSFENQNSILNREDSYSGLGFFKQFKIQCFGDWEFVNSSYRPLDQLSFYDSDLKEWQIRQYCECFEIAFKSYVESKGWSYFPYSLKQASDNIFRMAMTQITKIEHIPKDELYGSQNQKILTVICEGVGKSINHVVEGPDYPVDAYDEDSYDFLKDYSVFGTVAHGLYELCEAFSFSKGHNHFIRSQFLRVWHVVFGVQSSQMSKNQNEIGKRLLFHINKNVDENLDRKAKWGSPITKLLLSLDGLSNPPESDKRVYAEFYRSFLEILREKFPILYREDPKFAMSLLPESIEYDGHANKLVQKKFRGRSIELILNNN